MAPCGNGTREGDDGGLPTGLYARVAYRGAMDREQTEANVKPAATGRRPGRATRDVKLELRTPAWKALEDEATKLSMSIEELVGFSVLYYLADRDSGRIARGIPATPNQAAPTGDNPLRKLLED